MASSRTSGVLSRGGAPARRAAVASIALLVVAAATLSGCCAPKTVVWVPEGEPRTLESVEQSARDADLSPANGVSVEEAPEARNEVLVWLRRQGPDGERAASLLTQGFPERTAAVPVHVEIASVDGTRSLIVVEASGGPTGKLDRHRLWVFAFDSGQLIRSSSYQ